RQLLVVGVVDAKVGEALVPVDEAMDVGPELFAGENRHGGRGGGRGHEVVSWAPAGVGGRGGGGRSRIRDKRQGKYTQSPGAGQPAGLKNGVSARLKATYLQKGSRARALPVKARVGLVPVGTVLLPRRSAADVATSGRAETPRRF